MHELEHPLAEAVAFVAVRPEKVGDVEEVSTGKMQRADEGMPEQMFEPVTPTGDETAKCANDVVGHASGILAWVAS